MTPKYNIVSVDVTTIDFKKKENIKKTKGQGGVEQKIGFALNTEKKRLKIVSVLNFHEAEFPFRLNVEISAELQFAKKIPSVNQIAKIIHKENKETLWAYQRELISNITGRALRTPIYLPPQINENAADRKAHIEDLKQRVGETLEELSD